MLWGSLLFLVWCEGVPVIFLRPPSHPLLLLWPWPPDPSLLLWHQTWNVCLYPCFVGPFDIPHHNHHYLQQHSSHNPATPISQGATESFLHLLLSPHCPLPDVRQLCVYIRETEAGGRAGLQQRGCPCEHGGDPSAEPCHLHPEEQAGPPGSEKNDVQDENIKLKKKTIWPWSGSLQKTICLPSRHCSSSQSCRGKSVADLTWSLLTHPHQWRSVFSRPLCTLVCMNIFSLNMPHTDDIYFDCKIPYYIFILSSDINHVLKFLKFCNLYSFYFTTIWPKWQSMAWRKPRTE